MVISDPKQNGVDALLRRVYELYADYALKNPFYSLEMPIRCELFDEHLKTALDQAERLGLSSVWVTSGHTAAAATTLGAGFTHLLLHL